MTPTQIQSIIDTLKNAASAGFELLVKQQVVIGTQEAIGALALFIAAYVAIRYAKKSYAKIGSFEDNWYTAVQQWWLAGTASASVCAIALVGCGVWLGIDSFGHFVNPAGYAITNLIPGH